MYYLWNGQVGGWMTAGGSYSSELSLAKQYPREEALALVARRYNKFLAAYDLLPVRVEDLPDDVR